MNLLDELIKTARKKIPTHGSNYVLDILITTRERLQEEELTKDKPDILLHEQNNLTPEDINVLPKGDDVIPEYAKKRVKTSKEELLNGLSKRYFNVHFNQLYELKDRLKILEEALEGQIFATSKVYATASQINAHTTASAKKLVINAYIQGAQRAFKYNTLIGIDSYANEWADENVE